MCASKGVKSYESVPDSWPGFLRERESARTIWSISRRAKVLLERASD